MDTWLSIVLFLCATQGYVRAEGFYKVVGPQILRPNSEFHVAVSAQSTSSPTTVSVAVVGTSLNGRSYSVEDSATVLPHSTSIITLQIEDIEEGFYKIIARGTGGVEFQSTAPLKFVKKSYSVFIQTDKAVYKPGDKVLFRALILNPDLKPAADVRNEPVSVYVTDGAGNKVKEWKRINAPKGVYGDELQLSESPVLGNWNISVVVHEQIFNKTFQVAEYIVPKYLIHIDVPKHITFQENILTANIKALYSHGTKVKGDATVTVYPTIFSGVIQPIYQVPVRKVFPINGSLSVNFDISKELKLNDEYERNVIVDVIIEEEATGRRQNNSIEVQIHKYDYKMELVKTADYFKPGLKYTTFIKVINHDGSPLKNDRKSVTIRHGFSRADEVYQTKKVVLDRNGFFKLDLETPKNATNTTALRIDAQYYDLKERLPPVPAAVSFSNNFLQILLETERPIINLDVEVSIVCTEPMTYITYELIGRGDVIIANTFKVDNAMEYKFHFTATHAMVPTSHLLVSYIRDDGELISDSIDINVDGLLQNFIDIQTNVVEASPDSDIDLTIRAQPNSYVGLMAIDEKILSLKGGNDLTLRGVSEELDYYDPSELSPYAFLMKGSKANFFWKQGSSNSKDMFYRSGTSLLTNSLVTSRRPSLEDIYLRPVFYDSSTVKPDRGVGLNFHTVTRPPLAGPYAFSRIPRPVWDKPRVYLSDHLYDTWLFNNFSSGYDGKTSIKRRVPSSMNTWTITGFSLNPLHGLGLTTNPRRIKVKKPFSVTINLPHSVQRGEILEVPVVVINNLDNDITAEVTLHNQEHKFYFAEISNEVNGTSPKIELYRRKRVSVKKNSGGSVSFFIKTSRPGQVEIKATADSPSNQDTTIRQLNVKAEGETLYFTKTILIDLTKSNVFKGNVTFEIPKNVVPDSENVQVSVVGDLLGATVVNLDQLIRLPTASSEQNLVNFVPDLIVLKYLQSTQQLTPPIEKIAVNNLETSYQQQLTYKKSDGSFTIFGKEKEVGSIWITAYTAMSLVQAKNFIFVDKAIIDNAFSWLSDKQNKNGSFVEKSSVVHKEAQTPDDKSLALTAFVVLAFIENEVPISKYANVINKGLDYIARYIDEEDSEYTVAICSYVLQLSNHPSRLSAFNLLESKSKTDKTMKWWGKSFPESENKNPWHTLPKSLDIEATSYALLTLLEANLISDAMPVLQWLVGQRNSLGGFASSQDTRIGLFALYRMVLKLSSSSNMKIDFSSKEQEMSSFNINRDNAMIVQSLKIGDQARVVNVTASGSGLALFQVSYQYNMNVTGPWPLFTLDPQVDKNSNRHHLQLSICTAFVTRNLTDTPESNMAIMEVHFPSGFTADIDSLPSLEVSQNVQKVETKNDYTTVVLYFNNLTVHEYCPTISAYQTHRVVNQKPVPVIIYDYYDSSRHARIFYRGRKTSMCDICKNEEECADFCMAEAAAELDRQRAEESRSADDATQLTLSASCFLLILANLIYR
ncbi:PREDICTED: CD109 antigen-like [Nicrophorus vespilloides]|uniref:CD109 antigen-like n=1 Tax=Nicrophorus vespilloides TaxID=110193 RepID=A0ABM1ND71_NICVS|nr:PREDICTED: CD109 antigen-like [Nicrophorus vespilloides]